MNQILLVDDDPDFSYLIEKALKECRPDCLLNTLSITTDLVDWLEHNKKPDLILLDINMPNPNGFEVLRLIKGDSRFKTIPVVMYTSSNQKIDVEYAYDNGANAYLVKPSNFKTLKAQLLEVSNYWFDIVRVHGAGRKIQGGDTWFNNPN